MLHSPGHGCAYGEGSRVRAALILSDVAHGLCMILLFLLSPKVGKNPGIMSNNSHAVGVQRPYCGALGKRANGQAGVCVG